MTKNEMRKEYFSWICGIVGSKKRRDLLYFLFSTPFRYSIPMDGNRYEDGVNLRYKFADSKGHHYRFTSSWIDDRECSVLEMMVALAMRIEENITGDPDIGDQTAKWFNAMISSMGLAGMTDNNFDIEEASFIVERMLDREYASDGDGGLFKIHHAHKDLRTVEIWCQAHMYIGEVLGIE